MNGPTADCFELALDDGPPQYAWVDPSDEGSWVHLRRWGAGIVLASNEADGISVYPGDEELNPGAGDFADDVLKVLRVLFSAGHPARDAYDIVRRHPEFSVRGPEHRGRLAAAGVLADCVAHDPDRMPSLYAALDVETEVFAEIVLSSYWGVSVRRQGWLQLNDEELEELYDRVEIIEITAHGVAVLEEWVDDGRMPSRDQVMCFAGARRSCTVAHASPSEAASDAGGATTATGGASGVAVR